MEMFTRSPNPFFYLGDETGILLIHGFTGSPSELRPMGLFLRDLGYTVYAPLLKGHGTSPEELEKTTWQDWWNSVQKGYERLKSLGMKHIYIVGHSMGGLLAFHLALEESVDGIVSLCTPIWVKDWRANYVRFIRFFITYLQRSSAKDEEIEKRLVPYDRTPLKSVEELNRLIKIVKKSLPQIKVPTLVIQSEKDETVLPKSAQYIYDHIAAEKKEISWYEKSSHIITLDKERKSLFHEIHSFVNEINEQEAADH